MVSIVRLPRWYSISTLLGLFLSVANGSQFHLEETYKPCDGAVFLVIDVGVELSNNVFENTRSFIADKLFKDFDHYERLFVASYSDIFNPIEFSKGATFAQVRTALNNIQKSKNPSHLQTAMHDLDLEAEEKFRYHNHSYIFLIGKATIQNIVKSSFMADSLKKRGKLTLISTSNNADVSLLKKLTSHVFKWNAETTKAFRNYEKVFFEAFGCSDRPVTAKPTPPTQPPPTEPPKTDPTERPDPGYTPCDGAVYLFFDAGSQVSTRAFNNVKNFISDKLFVGFNHFERLVVGPFTDILTPFEHKTDTKFGDIRKELDKVGQSNKISYLRVALLDLVEEYINRDKDKQHSYVLFVGKTTQEDIDDSKEWVVDLKKAGKLTLISISKDNDVSKLKELTDNVFEWDAEANDVPDDYENVFLSAFGCKKD